MSGADDDAMSGADDDAMSGARNRTASGAEDETMSDAKDETISSSASELSFEDALAELEAIVRGLEGGQQKLADAITCYERGAALRRLCEAKLGEAEARVLAIVERDDGTLGMRPLAGDRD